MTAAALSPSPIISNIQVTPTPGDTLGTLGKAKRKKSMLAINKLKATVYRQGLNQLTMDEKAKADEEKEIKNATGAKKLWHTVKGGQTALTLGSTFWLMSSNTYDAMGSAFLGIPPVFGIMLAQMILSAPFKYLALKEEAKRKGHDTSTFKAADWGKLMIGIDKLEYTENAKTDNNEDLVKAGRKEKIFKGINTAISVIAFITPFIVGLVKGTLFTLSLTGPQAIIPLVLLGTYLLFKGIQAVYKRAYPPTLPVESFNIKDLQQEIF